ncbi:transmembrane prolyl 4-hydroxylase-like [Patiria miniata]|uniref:Fe2OG dioxygenase domain-containing protein n=1 Tax=Patiria miniata TaxID=46514 RepID=A0A914ASN3_PATMI|nr:transmembrane prolyl 4-hydroxylase-like [Patiria miniata]XP_038066361.1 transmembrane prolyl 4-hydroxylase-like [Patiria miniata]
MRISDLTRRCAAACRGEARQLFPLVLAALVVIRSAGLANSKEQPGDTGEKLTLFQLDPVEKGYVRDFEAEPDRVLQVETKALQPPLFEIRGFLSPDECDYIIEQALRGGLYPSGVNDDAYYKDLAQEEEGEVDDQDDGQAAGELDREAEERNADSVFVDLDVNDDMVLDTEELLSVLNTDNAFLRHKDVLQMYSDLGLDPDSDGQLTRDEFVSLVFSDRLADVERWVWQQTGHGENKIRESKQAWLGEPGPATDPVLAAMQRRVVSLTRLPESIVQWSEQLQVVRYEPGGHFHAHYDSNELDGEMDCMLNGVSGRFCRFMTILYYLDDDVSGGETAFPIADNGTYSDRATKTEIYDLSDHCHDANLYIKPEKGKAIMWYNHYINETTGWLGDLNLFSLHGGCEVLQGTKWIANNWIWVDDSYERQTQFLRNVQRTLSEEEQTKASVELSLPQRVASKTDLLSELFSVFRAKTDTCSSGDEL